jgi:hypothetical protein
MRLCGPLPALAAMALLYAAAVSAPSARATPPVHRGAAVVGGPASRTGAAVGGPVLRRGRTPAPRAPGAPGVFGPHAVKATPGRPPR